MKYAFLSAWAEQYKDFSAQLENINLAEDSLHLNLKKGGKLVILLLMRDSFIYHSAEQGAAKVGPELWPQLRNSRISEPRIFEQDRIIEFKLENTDIYGETRHYLLICELMPPKPNVILCKIPGMAVVDALQKYSLADNPMRMVLANQPYYPPQTSFMPELNPNLQIPAVEGTQANDINAYFALMHQHSQHKTDKDAQQIRKLKILEREQKKVQKRLKMQQQDLKNAEQAEYFHACAEAIKPNMGSIKAGQRELSTTDYLSPNLDSITVPLLPDKSPLQNLNHYIKKYQKAKNGLAIIRLNIAKTESELHSMLALIQRLQAGEDLDIDSRDNSQVMSQKVQQLDRILNLRIDDHWQIYIGRKAKENDYITTKLGKAQDWWFHSRIYRGAHVLLRNYKKQEPQPELIRMCCALAAWYSQAKFSVNVPVDYTQIRYVRKPRGSAAGFVTYTNYKTCFADPRDIRSVKSELGL